MLLTALAVAIAIAQQAGAPEATHTNVAAGAATPVTARRIAPLQLPQPVAGVAESTGPVMEAGQQDDIAGSLIIVGGGGRPEVITRRFIELAGGDRGRILVIPLASSEPVETGRESAATFRTYGIDARSLVPTRAEADADSIARVLQGVTGVWFSGGDQARITAVIRGTKLHRELINLYRRGAVIGGTSAGAAIMSDSMLTGSQYQAGVDTAVYIGDTYTRIARSSIELVGGLGFLPTVIVDQHFVQRERHNRLLSLVLERPHMLGAGISEATALEVTPKGTWRVLGNSVVVVYDVRQGHTTAPGSVLGASDIRMHIIPHGGTFDPGTAQATLVATSPQN